MRAQILLMTILVAGCANPSGPVPPPEGPMEEPNVDRNPVASVLDGPNPPPKLTLVLDQCSGFAVAAPRSTGLTEAEAPGNWSALDRPTFDFHLELFDCHRASIGGFERPAILLVESHENLIPGGNCGEGAGTTYDEPQVLVQIWTNDPEIRDFLEMLGVPAIGAKFDEKVESVGSARVTTWSFEPEGGPASSLTKAIASEPDTRTGIVYRRFWETPSGGISYFDWDRSHFFPGLDVTPFVGTIAPPLRSGLADEFYSELGSFLQNSNVIAPLTQFGDFECVSQL